MVTTPIRTLAPGRHRLTLDVDQRERESWVYVPQQQDEPDWGWPVVLAFHGGLSNAPTMVRFCELNLLGDQEGFVTVFPNGTGRMPTMKTWNAGTCCGYAHRENVDDVRYVKELLTDLKQRLPIDESRIYATGMSNGGMMCYQLADQMSETFAAIAPVGGTMANDRCAPKSPVPLLHIHGMDDQFVRYEGGVGPRSQSKLDFHSVDMTIESWIAANRANDTASRTTDRPIVDDGTWIERLYYAPIDERGAEIQLIKVHGGGHTWPGVESKLDVLGPVSFNLDANCEIWKFFQKHRRDQPT